MWMSILELLRMGGMYHLDKRKRGWMVSGSSLKSVLRQKLSSWKPFGLLRHICLASSAWHWLVDLSSHRKTLKVSLPTQSPTWAYNSLGSWGKMPTDLLPGADTVHGTDEFKTLYCVPKMIIFSRHFFLSWPWQTLGCLDAHWLCLLFFCNAHMFHWKWFLFYDWLCTSLPSFVSSWQSLYNHLPAALRDRNLGCIDRLFQPKFVVLNWSNNCML